MENCWFTSHSRGSDNQSSEKQCQVNLLWQWTLGTVPHLCLTCRDTVHQWEPAAQQSYYQPLVYCYNPHLSSQTCIRLKLLHDFCHLVWLTSWFLNNTPPLSSSYILIVFAGLLWFCHLVWLLLQVKAAVIPYIKTKSSFWDSAIC